MDSRDRALSLVQDLLAAPGSEQGWQDFLLHFCDTFGGSGANFIAHDFASHEGTVSLTAVTSPEAIATYKHHWHRMDPWAHHPAVSTMTAGTVVIGEQLVSAREMQRSAFYNDFGRHHDVFQCLTGLIEASRQAVSGISVNRSERAPSFTPEDASLAASLMPSIKRALQVHRRLAGAELMAANAMDVLDRLPHGVLLVSARGVVLSANRAASDILAARDGLSVDRGELRGSTAAVTQQLRAALDHAARISAGQTLQAGRTALALPRPSGRRPLSVVVAPLPERRAALVLNPAAAAVFVTDPEQRPLPDAGTIGAVLGLTRSEAQLVHWLLSGLSVEQTASHLGLRVDTVRKRLKAVFEKTNTHRQAELVRLVLTSVADV